MAALSLLYIVCGPECKTCYNSFAVLRAKLQPFYGHSLVVRRKGQSWQQVVLPIRGQTCGYLQFCPKNFLNNNRNIFLSKGQLVEQSRFLQMSSFEDVPENLPSTFPTGLTLSQQLLFRRYVEEVKNMSPAQCQTMIVELVKQTMLKDNIMRSLLKQPEVSLTSQLPNPEEFQSWEGDPYDLDISGDMIEPWPGFDPDTLKRKAEEENEKQDRSLFPEWTTETTSDEQD